VSLGPTCEYSRAEPWAIAAVRVTAAIESVVGRATSEEDSFGRDNGTIRGRIGLHSLALGRSFISRP
jgi:hypothetical protein